MSSYISQHKLLEDGKHELARKLLKIASISGSRVVRLHANQARDVTTEFLHEIGTTDAAIGDATAEFMQTTEGKIPSEMYYLEDTTTNVMLATRAANLEETTHSTYTTMLSAEKVKSDSDYTGHSTVLVILLIALLIILLICCITACLIAKSKRRSQFFGKHDCEPGCGGLSQPLLNKVSDASNKTSGSSMRN